MRKTLAIISSVILFIIVFFLLYKGDILLTSYLTELAVGLTLFGIAILYWGFKPEIEEIVRGKSDVILQKDSLCFFKFPYLVFLQQKPQKMTNMVYAVITAENVGKLKAKECEVEILLKNDKPYSSKVLSSLSVDSQGRHNPKTVSIDGNHGTIGFHPLALNLDTLQAFLPNHSFGVAGNFTGTLVDPDWYEIFGKTIYDEKQSEITPLGKVKIPEDILDKAEIPNDVQRIMDQGGFAVYLEFCQGKIRSKFYGHNDDEDVKKIILEHLTKIPQIDNILEDNEQLRHWTQKNHTIELKPF